MELSDAMEKAPATTGFDPGTFRLVAQCLNHYATPGPYIDCGVRKTYGLSSICDCEGGDGAIGCDAAASDGK
jgi:hypothetical protein